MVYSAIQDDKLFGIVRAAKVKARTFLSLFLAAAQLSLLQVASHPCLPNKLFEKFIFQGF